MPITLKPRTSFVDRGTFLIFPTDSSTIQKPTTDVRSECVVIDQLTGECAPVNYFTAGASRSENSFGLDCVKKNLGTASLKITLVDTTIDRFDAAIPTSYESSPWLDRGTFWQIKSRASTFRGSQVAKPTIDSRFECFSNGELPADCGQGETYLGASGSGSFVARNLLCQSIVTTSWSYSVSLNAQAGIAGSREDWLASAFAMILDLNSNIVLSGLNPIMTNDISVGTSGEILESIQQHLTLAANLVYP